VITQRRYEEQ